MDSDILKSCVRKTSLSKTHGTMNDRNNARCSRMDTNMLKSCVIRFPSGAKEALNDALNRFQ
jgi:hypothetical protein